MCVITVELINQLINRITELFKHVCIYDESLADVLPIEIMKFIQHYAVQFRII